MDAPEEGLLVPTPLGIYPVQDSVQAAIGELEGRLPINTRNDLIAALGLYHNTVLRQNDQPQESPSCEPSDPFFVPSR